MKSAVGEKKQGDSGTPAVGVGGRHGGSPLSGQGGGYQDSCIAAGAPLKKTDARLVELREIGLSRPWLTVAEIVGVDTFIEAWKAIDQQVEDINPGQREIYVPLFGSYLRFQRNRFIVALADQNAPVDEIRWLVRNVLCEDISERHITRILAKFKITA